MKVEQFTNPSGDLVRNASGLPQAQTAFVPNPLPPGWVWPDGLWPLLAEAREALGTLDGIGQTLPNPNLLLKPLRRREAITSSRMEGTVATPQELLLYELGPPSGPDSVEPRVEVARYNEALQLGINSLGDRPLNPHLMREMHRVLLLGVRGEEKSPGEFRSGPVMIGGTGRFVPPPADRIDELLDNLAAAFDEDAPVRANLHPIVWAFVVHYQLETIHPFKDGNGRIGRVVLSLMIWRAMRHAHPWLYLSEYFETYQSEYVRTLFEVSAKSAWGAWVQFCLEGVVSQANDAVRRCRLFNAIKDRYREAVTQPNARTHGMVEMLFDNPLVTIQRVRTEFGVSDNTARSDLKRLAEDGILSIVDNRYPTTYVAHELFDAAYGETSQT